MDWYQAEADCPWHPKTFRLARALGVDRVTAFGYLHTLWSWIARFAEDGDLSAYGADEIAAGCGWDGPPEQFIAAFRSAGYLDEHVAHEWWERNAARVFGERERQKAKREKEKGCSVERPRSNRGASALQDSTDSTDKEPPNPLAPARGNRRPRVRSMSTTEIEAAIDAIKSRHYPNPVTGPDATQLDRLRAELRGRETA